MVTLRSHPLMSYRGIPNWPPSGTSTCLKEKKTLKGEVGILKHVIREDQLPTKCFLVIEYGNEAYMGCVIFDDATFCEQIHDLLQHHHGRSMKEIGDLSLHDAL